MEALVPKKMVIPGPDGEEGDGGNGEDPVEAEEEQHVDHDVLFDFHGMISDLKSHDRVTDVSMTTFSPVPDFTIETIEHGLGITIPKRVTSFYRITDGLEFSWNWLDDDGQPRPGGGSHLWGFTEVFDVWLETLWTAPEKADDVDEDFLWSLRGLDRIDDDETTEMTVLCVEEGYPSYDLFIHDPQTGESSLLALSFVDYFHKLLQTRGVYGWQHIFSEDEDHKGEEARKLIEDLFPDADLDP